MHPGVRPVIAAVSLTMALVLRVAVPVLATDEPAEQTVVPLTPGTEQRVEAIAPSGEQRVETLDAAGLQHVTGADKSAARRGAEGVGKVVVGVLAAGISIGAMVASLLFL
jgi:hypothetical protein